MDVVEQPGSRRRPPVLPLLVVALLLGGADRVLHARGADGLREAVRQAQQAGVYADRRVAGTVQYAGPALTSASVPDAVRADLRALVGREAAGQLPALRSAREDVAGVRVLPWHDDLRQVRAAALAHLDARAAHLRAVAADVRVLYRPRPDVVRTGRAAAAALRRLGG